jgi:hypothetical protein
MPNVQFFPISESSGRILLSRLGSELLHGQQLLMALIPAHTVYGSAALL